MPSTQAMKIMPLMHCHMMISIIAIQNRATVCTNDQSIDWVSTAFSKQISYTVPLKSMSQLKK